MHRRLSANKLYTLETCRVNRQLYIIHYICLMMIHQTKLQDRLFLGKMVFSFRKIVGVEGIVLQSTINA